ncbi:NAD(P)-binding protein [Choiromyces venosus 120613-1]|uniref:NAD(P)-binding protein n=1 Tax=Choiromyces venosus 120613-1 TaxID=1336337 RepID=A0A3N4JKE6_9PEZI|nr:NAD(P)-binding protein [Choiromyces venosus 120613-1]
MTTTKPKVLLTGANGFVAAHVLQQLIQANYHITGTVRTEEKAALCRSFNPEYEGKARFIVLPDFTKQESWNQIFQETEYDYVIHTAAPLMSEENTDFDRHYLEPNVLGNLGMLNAVSEFGKNVKHVSITSSICTVGIFDPAKGVVTGKRFTAEDWNSTTEDMARKAKSAFINYCVAKTSAEKAVWEYVKTKNPHFSVSVMIPSPIMGPCIQPITSLSKTTLKTDVLYPLFNGTFNEIPPSYFSEYIDVRDVAHAHINALINPAASNQRIILSTTGYSARSAVQIMEKHFPIELRGRLPADNGAEDKPPVDIDSEAGRVLLGGYTSLEECTVPAVRRLLELEGVFGRGGTDGEVKVGSYLEEISTGKRDAVSAS